MVNRASNWLNTHTLLYADNLLKTVRKWVMLPCKLNFNIISSIGRNSGRWHFYGGQTSQLWLDYARVRRLLGYPTLLPVVSSYCQIYLPGKVTRNIWKVWGGLNLVAHLKIKNTFNCTIVRPNGFAKKESAQHLGYTRNPLECTSYWIRTFNANYNSTIKQKPTNLTVHATLDFFWSYLTYHLFSTFLFVYRYGRITIFLVFWIMLYFAFCTEIDYESILHGYTSLQIGIGIYWNLR